MSRLPTPAFMLVQKLRHEVLTAHPGQISVSPFITVKQAEALLRWIDKHQEKP